MYIGVVTALLTAVAFSLFGADLLSYFDAEEISSVMYLVPVAMFISVVSAVVGQWLIRKRAFTLTAKVTVWQSLLMSAIKAGLGLVHPTAVVLVVTNTLSGLLSSAMMFFGWRRAPGHRNESNTASEPRSNAWALAKQHSDFAVLRTPQNLINSISHSLPVMLLATHSGPAAVGYFSIATAVLAMPAGLIGNSFMQVFYPRVTDAIRDREDARSLIVKATAGLALTGALPAILVVAAGPALFAFVFGAGWRTAGVYAQWLSIWLLFQYINKPAVCAIPALGLQRGLLVYELFSTGTKVLALYLGFVIFKSDVAAIALFSVFGVLAYSWLILWVIVRSGRSINASRVVAI
jgi:O-antigen/teichoic acid export membrane protein